MLIRILTAAAVTVSAVVHFKLWLDGFSDIAVVGPLFLLNAAGGVVIAVTVVGWRHWLPPLAAVGFGAATLVAFLLSTTVGFVGVHETWTGASALVAAASEAAVVLFGGASLLLERRAGSPAQPERGFTTQGAHLD